MRIDPARLIRPVAMAFCLAALSACVSLQPGVGTQVPWSELKGFADESLDDAWPAFEQSCIVLSDRGDPWDQICREVRLLAEADDATRRSFLRARFVPHRMNPEPDNPDGLFTGYYEPLLEGSRVRDKRFRYAIYGRPDDLLVVELGELYPDLAGRRLRGRLDGQRVVPYFSREEIGNGGKPLRGNELLWVDDPVALFFLHIQGSGVVRLRDGSYVGVGYADQNGHPYRAIGAALIANDEIAREDMSLQAIRDWLQQNPEKAEELMNSNPSYVFFEKRDTAESGPLGSLGVPLTATRSVAVDRKYIELGLPIWLQTSLPIVGDQAGGRTDELPYNRLVFAQDTGGAISGAVRADLFWGRGQLAEHYAGRMRQPGSMYLLLPKATTVAGP